MNHTAENAYGSQRTQSWNRVDMLLALYEATLRSIDGMIEFSSTEDADQLQAHRMKAIRQVLGIASGLDLDQGAVAEQTARLCEFVHHAIVEGSRPDWQSARTVIATLHEAFLAVRGEASQLEANGHIPRLDANTMLELSV